MLQRPVPQLMRPPKATRLILLIDMKYKKRLATSDKKGYSVRREITKAARSSCFVQTRKQSSIFWSVCRMVKSEETNDRTILLLRATSTPMPNKYSKRLITDFALLLAD